METWLRGDGDLIGICVWGRRTAKLYMWYVIEREERVLIATSTLESALQIVETTEEMGLNGKVSLLGSHTQANILVSCLIPPTDPHFQASIQLLIIDIVDSALSSDLFSVLQAFFLSFPTVRKAIFTNCLNPTRLNSLSASLHSPITVSMTGSGTLVGVRHYKVECEREDWRLDTLPDLLEVISGQPCVVYFSSRKEMDYIAYYLAEKGFLIAAIHAKMPKQAIEKVLEGFSVGTIGTLLCSDPIFVSSSLGVHYRMPTAEQYCMRMSRGRLGGRTLSIVLKTEEKIELATLEKTLDVRLEDLPADASTWLY